MCQEIPPAIMVRIKNTMPCMARRRICLWMATGQRKGAYSGGTLVSPEQCMTVCCTAIQHCTAISGADENHRRRRRSYGADTYIRIIILPSLNWKERVLQFLHKPRTITSHERRVKQKEGGQQLWVNDVKQRHCAKWVSVIQNPIMYIIELVR
jgi:hypothetical protein